MIEQIQGQPVGPVQILHDEQHRAALGELHGGTADRQEELKLRGRPVRRSMDGSRGKRPGPVEQLADDLNIGAYRLPSVVGHLLQLRQQALDKGQVRKREIFIASGRSKSPYEGAGQSTSPPGASASCRFPHRLE